MPVITTRGFPLVLTRSLCGGTPAYLPALAVLMTAAYADPVIKPYFEFKQPKMISIAGDISLDQNGALPPSFGGYSAPGVSLGRTFEGISQYDGAAFGRNFIPPDTNGAVGKTQYMETTNGAYAVFDKSTGLRTSLVSDVDFWAAAGQTGASGDSRVMYNAAAQRWIAISFGADVKDIQIAVSDTSNALGAWKSTKFEGYAGLGFGGTADYPTLAMDKNAVYIATNNFAPASAGGTNSLRGTTLDLIPMDSLFGLGAPSTAGMKQLVTNLGPGSADRGFAIQGVNSSSVGSTGTVVAASMFNFDSLAYKINGLTTSSSAGASAGAVTYLGESAYTLAGPARQPSANTNNKRRIDTLDDRISSSVYEANGRIYGVHTVNTTADGRDEARVRYFVLNANTMALLDEGDIGEAGFDYFQGSLAVNAQGDVVIAYNRSGAFAGSGLVSIMARTFTTTGSGKLVQFGDEVLIKQSLVDDYHNGSLDGQTAVGRQRWGDYSSVSLDPEDSSNFWIIGEFAREYNNEAGGHPGGTGGSRWGTFIAALDFDPNLEVPEPSSWSLMLLGLGFVVYIARKRKAPVAFA